jgi:hypothetical protein
VKIVDNSTGGFGHLNVDDLKIPVTRTSITSGATYKIIARHSGKVLDVDGSVNVLADGANVQQWEYLGVSNQKWMVTAMTGGYYKIKSVASNKVLEIDSASVRDGGQAQQWTDFGYHHQQWTITPVSGANGYFTISNRNSNKVLDIDASSQANGARVQQWTPGGFTHQQFQFVRVDGGDVFMASVDEDIEPVIKREDEDNMAPYPNPFRESVNIPVQMEKDGVTTVDIYNASGMRIRTLTKQLPEGIHDITWDGTSEGDKTVSDGLYIYKVYANGRMKSGRVIKVGE